jgi:hypothetical protein
LGNLVPNGDFEVDASGWPNLTNVTIARSTSRAHTGTASLAITAVATADMQIESLANASGFPVTPGAILIQEAWMYAATVGRTTFLSFDWFIASGTFLSSSPATNLITTPASG